MNSISFGLGGSTYYSKTPITAKVLLEEFSKAANSDDNQLIIKLASLFKTEKLDEQLSLEFILKTVLVEIKGSSCSMELLFDNNNNRCSLILRLPNEKYPVQICRINIILLFTFKFSFWGYFRDHFGLNLQIKEKLERKQQYLSHNKYYNVQSLLFIHYFHQLMVVNSGVELEWF